MEVYGQSGIVEKSHFFPNATLISLIFLYVVGHFISAKIGRGPEANCTFNFTAKAQKYYTRFPKSCLLKNHRKGVPEF